MLSVILLSYKSKERLIVARDKLDQVLVASSIPYELIIVDDGSLDGSYEIALTLEKKYSNVRAYELSRNYTSHYSIMAGLKMSKGDCATMIMDDEQTPYESVTDMYREWQKGHKIIFPYRTQRTDPWLTKQFAQLFYKIISAVSDFSFPAQGLDSFFIDREIIDIINERIHPINTTTFTELLRLGYNPLYVPYVRFISKAAKSRWTFKKKVKLAKDWFFSTSTFPIKLITYVGLTVSLLAFLIIIFYLYIKLFGNNNYWKVDVKGWTSIILAISFFSGLIMLSLGIISEYIYRIYEEVKNRPGYIIKKKPNDIVD